MSKNPTYKCCRHCLMPGNCNEATRGNNHPGPCQNCKGGKRRRKN